MATGQVYDSIVMAAGAMHNQRESMMMPPRGMISQSPAGRCVATDNAMREETSRARDTNTCMPLVAEHSIRYLNTIGLSLSAAIGTVEW